MSSTPERDTSATPVPAHFTDERPSKTRYVVLGFLCTLAFVLDRKSTRLNSSH